MKERIVHFGIAIDPLTMEEAVDACLKFIDDHDRICPYVVTPNVNHVVQLQKNTVFQQAYSNAALILTDGKPLSGALKLLGDPVPEVVPGSDLVPRIFDAVTDDKRLTVYLLGAGHGVAERASRVIHESWNNIDCVGWYSPPYGFESNEDENSKIVGLINNAHPDLLIIGLGAPKQEIWIGAHREQINSGLALCVGATIDFLAGEQRRAPIWMRKFALEWMHRLLSDPRRLFRRYMGDALSFPLIVFREWSGSSRARKVKNSQ